MTPKGDDEEADDSGVDAGHEPADVPTNDGHVQSVEADLWEGAVEEVAWKRSGEAQNEAQRHPLVGASPAVHLFCEASPGDSLRVERLETLG